MKCPNCGTVMNIATEGRTAVCPNCKTIGKSNPHSKNLSKPKKKGGCLKVILIIIGVLVVIGIIGAVTGGEKDNEKKEAKSTKTEDKAKNTETSKQDDPGVPAEYNSALKKAKDYNDTMHMSKQGLYDQLTSEYGEKFSPEAAQYAVDNIQADWNANALAKAKDYQSQMNMSPEAIRDQLCSEYGEKFTPEEAAYAIENLNN